MRLLLCSLLLLACGCQVQTPPAPPKQSLVSTDIGIAGADADVQAILKQAKNALAATIPDSIKAFVTDIMDSATDAHAKLLQSQKDSAQAAADYAKQKADDDKKLAAAIAASHSRLNALCEDLEIGCAVLFGIGVVLFVWSKVQPDTLLTELGEGAVIGSCATSAFAFVLAFVSQLKDEVTPWLAGCVIAILVFATVLLVGGISYALWQGLKKQRTANAIAVNSNPAAATIVKSVDAALLAIPPAAKATALKVMASVQSGVPQAGQLVDAVQKMYSSQQVPIALANPSLSGSGGGT
jgi:hypothetical protein